MFIPILIGGAILLGLASKKTEEEEEEPSEAQNGLNGSWHAKNSKYRFSTDELQRLKPGYKFTKGGDIVNIKTGKVFTGKKDTLLKKSKTKPSKKQEPTPKYKEGFEFVMRSDNPRLKIHFGNILKITDEGVYYPHDNDIRYWFYNKQRKSTAGIMQKDIDKSLEIQPKKTSKTLTISQKVEQAKADLLKMTTNAELRNWAIANQMDNRSAFPKFKKALLEIGIDYNKVRANIAKEKTDTLKQKITSEIKLYSDYKSSYNQFAITDQEGNPLWYGRDFDNPDTQAEGELNAAKKAIWLANKIASLNNEVAVKLILVIDAQWLVYQDNPKQKGYALKVLADKYNVLLQTEWVPGTENLADKYTIAGGFKKWSDNGNTSLTELLSKTGLAGGIIVEALGKVKIKETPISTTILKIMPQQIINYIAKNFNAVYGSPFSGSFYSQPGQSWDFTPPNQIRVLDHWNFWSKNYNDPSSELKQHSITNIDVANNTHWTIARKNDKGIYEVVLTLPKKEVSLKKYNPKYDLLASKEPKEVLFKFQKKKRLEAHKKEVQKRNSKIAKGTQYVKFDRTYTERINSRNFNKIEEKDVVAILTGETNDFYKVKFRPTGSEFRYKKSTISNFKYLKQKPRNF